MTPGTWQGRRSKYALHVSSNANAKKFCLLDFRAPLLSYDNETLAWVVENA